MILETQKEENVVIYGKLGFEVKCQIEVGSFVGKSKFWIMRKNL